jgi:hypothetical protein
LVRNGGSIWFGIYKRCILSDKTPGISFNDEGICNYCIDEFPNYLPKGEPRLIEILNKIKNKPGSEADCLIGLSGGKDSTYSLVKLKEEYGMRVEAFSYVHEGSVNFALENAKKVCQNLNIKLHIVSLEKQRHLKTFTGFFKAYLKSPSVTTAGIMCVACKHLHLLGYNIAKERNIPSIVWSTSPLEYSPFLALKYKGGKNQFERESNSKGAVLLLKEMFSSIEFPLTFIKHFDTCFNGCLAAFPTSNYLMKKYPEITPIMFYDYINWSPLEIKNYIKKYNWKEPDNFQNDWHSDCLFNIFKEYTFQNSLGVSYTDAFLSNQVRYGLINRDTALDELRSSKMFFSEKIFDALDYLGLKNLKEKINVECFNVNL